jgi:hypothetical protein
MKNVFVLLPLCVFASAAQDNGLVVLQQRLAPVTGDPVVMMGIKSAVMGPTVKNAPYSALETMENTQTLADGTHIDRTIQTMVYRDSAGRMRRETPDSITIWDPVANVSYSLDPKTQTAMRLPLGLGPATRIANEQRGLPPDVPLPQMNLPRNGQEMRFVYRSAGVATADLPPPPPLPPPGAGKPGDMFFLSAGAMPGLSAMQVKLTPKSESLGQQLVEGINAEGTRMTSTIEAGQIGNDRPIQIVDERWYSHELATLVKMTHSDPRTGQETLELTGISRVEPSPDLFQVPANYQIQGR